MHHKTEQTMRTDPFMVQVQISVWIQCLSCYSHVRVAVRVKNFLCLSYGTNQRQNYNSRFINTLAPFYTTNSKFYSTQMSIFPKNIAMCS